MVVGRHSGMLANRHLAAVFVLVLAACGSRDGLPREFGPLALAKGENCPAIAGRYIDSSAPVARMLAGRFIPYDSTNAEWDSFELTGSADTGFVVTVRYLDGEERTGRARKGGGYRGDYYCEDGWLQVGDRNLPHVWDDEVAPASFRANRRALRVAPGRDGALVARLDLISYDELVIWCGDGCKGIPLPFTWETRSQWSAARRWDPEAPAPHVGASARGEPRTRAAHARSRGDRISLEEQALAQGPAIDGQEEMRTRGLAALLPGMLLRGVTPRDSGWHLSLEFGELPQLDRFLVRLAQSGEVAEIHVAPLYRARSTEGRWIDVVYVRYRKER